MMMLKLIFKGIIIVIILKNFSFCLDLRLQPLKFVKMKINQTFTEFKRDQHMISLS